MSRRKILNLIDNSVKELPANKKFLTDVMAAIERVDIAESRTPSKWYSPSSLSCIRGMYYKRTSAPLDTSPSDYQTIGMADTGTRRHEAIQSVLLKMKEYGFDWEYVNVADYVALKHIAGKCLSTTVTGAQGAETALFDSILKISFRCDGILRRISTNEYYLFEFKNQTSFKFNGKETVDDDHVKQVVCYCTALDLDKAFVLYENRDTCALECPEIFEVTPEMKQEICINHIMECEYYVEHLQVPPKPQDEKSAKCRWCRYRTQCRKDGN